jgi:diguanylate cyclase (GGDEF)-like protein
MQLKQLAERDGLTGIYNRRVMENMLSALWRQAVAERSPLVVMMVDIDCFKAYNDWFGHPKGDECLRRIAKTLDGLARRPSDYCARYGGEEFCLIYPGADATFAATMADAVRTAVRMAELPHPGSSVAPLVTVSVGAIACRPRSGLGPSDLIEHADGALYEAKRAGRDRAVVSTL